MQMVASQACYSQPVGAEQQTYSQAVGFPGFTQVQVTDAEVEKKRKEKTMRFGVKLMRSQ